MGNTNNSSQASAIQPTQYSHINPASLAQYDQSSPISSALCMSWQNIAPNIYHNKQTNEYLQQKTLYYTTEQQMNSSFKMLLKRVHDYNPYVVKVVYLKKCQNTGSSCGIWLFSGKKNQQKQTQSNNLKDLSNNNLKDLSNKNVNISNQINQPYKIKCYFQWLPYNFNQFVQIWRQNKRNNQAYHQNKHQSKIKLCVCQQLLKGSMYLYEKYGAFKVKGQNLWVSVPKNHQKLIHLQQIEFRIWINNKKQEFYEYSKFSQQQMIVSLVDFIHNSIIPEGLCSNHLSNNTIDYHNAKSLKQLYEKAKMLHQDNYHGEKLNHEFSDKTTPNRIGRTVRCVSLYDKPNVDQNQMCSPVILQDHNINRSLCQNRQNFSSPYNQQGPIRRYSVREGISNVQSINYKILNTQVKDKQKLLNFLQLQGLGIKSSVVNSNTNTSSMANSVNFIYKPISQLKSQIQTGERILQKKEQKIINILPQFDNLHAHNALTKNRMAYRGRVQNHKLMKVQNELIQQPTKLKLKDKQKQRPKYMQKLSSHLKPFHHNINKSNKLIDYNWRSKLSNGSNFNNHNDNHYGNNNNDKRLIQRQRSQIYDKHEQKKYKINFSYDSNNKDNILIVDDNNQNNDQQIDCKMNNFNTCNTNNFTCNMNNPNSIESQSVKHIMNEKKKILQNYSQPSSKQIDHNNSLSLQLQLKLKNFINDKKYQSDRISPLHNEVNLTQINNNYMTERPKLQTHNNDEQSIDYCDNEQFVNINQDNQLISFKVINNDNNKNHQQNDDRKINNNQSESENKIEEIKYVSSFIKRQPQQPQMDELQAHQTQFYDIKQHQKNHISAFHNFNHYQSSTTANFNIPPQRQLNRMVYSITSTQQQQEQHISSIQNHIDILDRQRYFNHIKQSFNNNNNNDEQKIKQNQHNDQQVSIQLIQNSDKINQYNDHDDDIAVQLSTSNVMPKKMNEIIKKEMEELLRLTSSGHEDFSIKEKVKSKKMEFAQLKSEMYNLLI